MKKSIVLLLFFFLIFILTFQPQTHAADVKISELPEETAPEATDVVPLVVDMAGARSTKRAALTNIPKAWGITATELGYLFGLTSNLQTQLNSRAPLASPTFTGVVTFPTPFTLGAVSVTATGTEINYLVGVTSAIQTQFGNKQPLNSNLTAFGGLSCATNEIPKMQISGNWGCGADATGGSPSFDTIAGGTNITAAMQVGTGASLGYIGSGTIDATHYKGITTPSAAEFGYLGGVTSAIQTQIDGKAASGHNHAGQYIPDIAGPTAGNFPTITAGGELQNSSYGPSSFSATGHSHTASNVTDFNNAAKDAAGAALTNTATVNLSYNAGARQISGAVNSDSSVQKIDIRKNTGGTNVGSRRRLNFIEGSNVTITAADDAGNNEVSITIAAPGATGYTQMQEEGSNITQRTTLNFVGAGFTAADDAGNSRTNLTLSSELNAIAGLSSTGIAKRTGSGTWAIASSGVDYAPATSGTSIQKGNGSGGFSSASAGTDYQAPVVYSGLDASIPATCTAPSFYYSTDLKILYVCTAANTWTALFAVGADGSYKLTLPNNTSISPTPSAHEIYFEGNVLKINQNGTEYSSVIGPSGIQINFSGTLTNGKACTYATGGAISCNSDLGGTIGGSTGSTDNADLRADGTGGATIQSSLCTTDDAGNKTCTSFRTPQQASTTPDSVLWRGYGTNGRGFYMDNPNSEPANSFGLSVWTTEPLAGQVPYVSSFSTHHGSWGWLSNPVTGPASPLSNGLVKFTGTGQGTDNAGAILGTMTDGYYCTYTSTGTLISCNTSIGAIKSALSLGKSDVGLGNVDNTSDATKDAASATLTNKTIASNAHTSSSNTIKQIKYVWLTSPVRCDETGALLDTTKTNATFGQCKFSNSAAKTGNYAIYKWAVPSDIDTTIDLTARIYFRLSNTDTGKHSYCISKSSIAGSASADGSYADEVCLNFGGDASGAANDLEIFPAAGSAATAMTGWKSAVTANQMLLIKVGRAGDDATNDTSTVDSYSEQLVIGYGSTQ